MLLSILIAIGIGILAGIITGLTPGIHINLISALLVSSAGLLLGFTTVLPLACFIIAMSVTHTFLDTIPSVFLGAPESATALGVLPGHRYLLRGKGYTAVKLTIIGSLFGLLTAICLFPLLVPVVGFLYPLLQPFIGYMLMVVAVFMIVRDRKWYWALLIFLGSGLLGLIVFNLPYLNNPLFPLLSGLFGISTLLVSLNENEVIPKQQARQSIKLEKGKTLQAVLSGTLSGWITSVFPGIGSATAAVISLQLTRKLGDYGFMILIGSISTVNFALSLVTLFVLDKARNGSVIAVQSLLEAIALPHILVFLSVSLIAAGVAVCLGLRISKLFSGLMSKVNYRLLLLGIMGLITLLTLVLSGWIGLMVLLTATAIGLLPALQKTSRTHGMGCLLIPVIIWFLV